MINRHIFFHKGFNPEELIKYGFTKSKYNDYELWINNKLAVVVHSHRHRWFRKYHLSFECCTAKPTIELLSVIIKMSQDNMFVIYEESTEDIKKRKIAQLTKELESLKDKR